MKIIFFANTSWFLFNFNLKFGLKLLKDGHDIIFLAPADKFSNKIKEAGINFVSIPMVRSSINPFHQINLILWMFKFLKKESPDFLHNFTLKTVFLGSLAGQIAGVKSIVNELTGLGFIYTSNSLKATILKFFSNLILKYIFLNNSSKLVLLNKNDFNYFYYGNNIPKKSLFLIFGVGVDCHYYSPFPQLYSASFKVLFPARVLWDKGVFEFVEASKIVKKSYQNIEFLIAGDVDPGNPTSVDISYLISNERSGYIRWLGHINGMRDLYLSCDVVALPSYREGLPTSLTEAASCGLPIITTDVPGCKDVVDDGINGLLIPPKNYEKLAEAIVFLYENPEKCKEFGISSRDKALKVFSEHVIFKQRIDLYSFK